MIFDCIRSEGIAHNSWLIGDRGEAVVIDPRRDCRVYIDRAMDAGMRVAHVLETHRNEDYLVGSRELAFRTEAEVWHADEQWEYLYGNPVRDGQQWRVGSLTLSALHTPGHTPGSMSYLLSDSTGGPWALFSGDTLFAGDVGRMDFMGEDRLAEMGGLMHDTLFRKILMLDDGVLLCPAHGHGSSCGGAIADRVWTTIGIERARNPKLQFTDKSEFIDQVARLLPHPPYFHHMEELNLSPPLISALPTPTPLSPDEFAARMRYSQVLDTRMELGFGAAHVPGALSIWRDGVPSFAGWFLGYDRPILLVTDGGGAEPVVRSLLRIGFDNIAGVLGGGMNAWHTAGRESTGTRTETVGDLCGRMNSGQHCFILDVRAPEEIVGASIPGSHNVHLTELPARQAEIPRDRPVSIFCGSGLRSMTAASWLQARGHDNLTVALGGVSSWKRMNCPVERG